MLTQPVWRARFRHAWGSSTSVSNTTPAWDSILLRSRDRSLAVLDPYRKGRCFRIRNTEAAWSPQADKDWMPVDLYVGGQEHAVLHLLYARFWHKVCMCARG